jgi:hypothetical protein
MKFRLWVQRDRPVKLYVCMHPTAETKVIMPHRVSGNGETGVMLLRNLTGIFDFM